MKIRECIEIAKYINATMEICPRTVTAARMSFLTTEMAAPVNALRKVGFVCNGALAAKLWSRYSQDQCATWITMEREDVERFVAWVSSEMKKEEALS